MHHAIRDISSHPSTKSSSSSSSSKPSSGDKPDEIRYDLLISRLIRLHWDRNHLSRVKREYEGKYGQSLERVLENILRGDFAEFMVELARA